MLVTASSDALQGDLNTTTSSNGDYLLRFLPPGDYTLRFELDGFETVEQTVKVSAAQRTPIDVTLTVGTVSEVILVTSNFETLSKGVQSSNTFTDEFIEALPVNRDITGAVTLNAGVSSTGPGGNLTISGSQSYENLFLVNGVVVNENLRGQPFDLFIEDAIEETTTSTSGISAEYGRFGGGVVNVITKSGGNQFSGSLRFNVTNDDWQERTPLTNSRTDDVTTTPEVTLGGFVMKDRLWFFLAGRDFERNESRQTTATQISFPNNDEEQRLEGKLTLNLGKGNRLTGTYMDIDEKDGGVTFGSVLDLASVYDRELPQTLLAGHYSGVLTSNFFVEAQYSEREFAFVDSGSRFTDLINGTLFVDSPTSQRWHAPTFCGVCKPDEERNNENFLVKASWFLSGGKSGTHDLVFGYDSFNDIRSVDNHQSGSDYRIILTRTLIDPDGTTLYPVFDAPVTYIQWNPILVTTKGTDFKTNSLFVNDSWRLGDRWSFNIGLRYDENDGVNANDEPVVDDSKISPRLGFSWDVKGDGEWVVRASAAEYTTAIANNQADATSAAGRPATLTWFYEGPPINAGIPFDANTRIVTNTAGVIDADTALQMLWDWFDSVGGNSTDPTRSINIPGGTTAFLGSLSSPSTEELSLGFSKVFGRSGLMRVDYVRRDGTDFYSSRRDLDTGQVLLPNGRTVADLTVIENEDSVLERTYDGLHTSLRWRFGDRWDVGGNWTWSHLRGNVDGETANSGPVSSGVFVYPEYALEQWNFPRGDLAADQRHRVNAWATYSVLNNERQNLSVSLLQRFASGRPYEVTGAVDTRPFVTNPGYRTPPSSQTYFFTGRGALTLDDVTSTDFALNYAFKWNLGGRSVSVFLQPEVLNIFDEDTIDNPAAINQTVYTNRNSDRVCGGARCARFNPFTETPVEGVHWAKDAQFGQASSEAAFQQPRTFRFSLGFRF